MTDASMLLKVGLVSIMRYYRFCGPIPAGHHSSTASFGTVPVLVPVTTMFVCLIFSRLPSITVDSRRPSRYMTVQLLTEISEHVNAGVHCSRLIFVWDKIVPLALPVDIN